jgi:hypothetical protein
MELLGFTANLYLTYVASFFSANDVISAAPALLKFGSSKAVVLPRTAAKISTFETGGLKQKPTTFWEHIMLLITDTWFLRLATKREKASSTR